MICTYNDKFDFQLNLEDNTIEWDGRKGDIKTSITVIDGEKVICIHGTYNKSSSFLTPTIKLSDITFSDNIKALVDFFKQQQERFNDQFDHLDWKNNFDHIK